MINAGNLDQIIEFDEATVTRGTNGEELITWTPVLTGIWAEVLPIRGRERLASSQILADVDTLINVRWSEDIAPITPKHRIRHGSTIYNIKSILNVRSAGVKGEIQCQAGTNRG